MEEEKRKSAQEKLKVLGEAIRSTRKKKGMTLR